MPVAYTNRKGYKYYLCQRMTKTGKLRYYFSREPKVEVPDQIPGGYHISENVNGIVSLVKDQPRLILPQELTGVEASLNRHPKGHDYRFAVKKNQIIIYERLGPDVESLRAIFGSFSPLPAANLKNRIQEQLDKMAHFSPVMCFTLVDPEKRNFQAKRWCYLGEVEDWIEIGESGKLNKLLRRLISKLGTEDFYELF